MLKTIHRLKHNRIIYSTRERRRPSSTRWTWYCSLVFARAFGENKAVYLHGNEQNNKLPVLVSFFIKNHFDYFKTIFVISCYPEESRSVETSQYVSGKLRYRKTSLSLIFSVVSRKPSFQ
jgi:hypothetical protein